MAGPLIERLIHAGFAAEQDKTDRQWDGFLARSRSRRRTRRSTGWSTPGCPTRNLACRIRARSAFYQASGAFGFRDQFAGHAGADAAGPEPCPRQILNAASRQFPQGDVQHWWLPRTGAGVRTLISDDVVWLAYATAHYVAVTGDAGVLDEELAFLDGPDLGERHESFFQPDISEERSSLYDHCARALDLAITRTGAHGLPLILGGDWNDGMNRVGIAGKGESVWLGWFLIKALDAMSAVAETRGDQPHAEAWRAHRSALKAASRTMAGWRLVQARLFSMTARRWFGDQRRMPDRFDRPVLGRPVRRRRSPSVGARHGQYRQQADRSEAGLIRLVYASFEHSVKDPGYVKSYPPGVRENGGQYTHAAIWVAYALAEMGDPMTPIGCFRCSTPSITPLPRTGEIYRVEPYVVAADVYGEGDKTGRGGWTWYTGSAGWLYRTAVEAILGIHREGDRLRITPSLPAAWPGYSARLVQDGRIFEISVFRKTKLVRSG